MEHFKKQIDEDIKLIQKEWNDRDSNLFKDEYAFNYWILSKIYNVDEELIPNFILEYNDKSIDCYTHFEDSKELFIIQNKYYSDNYIKRNDVSDFLQTPLTQLKNNLYKKSTELQDLFNQAIIDPDYKIWLHFYITNDKRSSDIELLFNEFNMNIQQNSKAQVRGKIFYLKDIYNIYFGETFKEDLSFDFTLNTKNKGTILQILPQEYELSGMSEAYYIMTPITELFEMYRKAQIKQYPIFEENIREYLGKNIINNGIIETLKNKNDGKNFFYYNNGITVICKGTKKSGGLRFSLTLIKPQIVNGCQTVNTIYEVLSSFKPEDIEKEFKDVYVMVKVLIYNPINQDDKKPTFYKDIVKFTNKQNNINEDAFGASRLLFLNLKKYFKERGFLLQVKPSDNYNFKKFYSSNKSELMNLISKAKDYVGNSEVETESTNDLIIPLEKLLQLYLALFIDGHTAYQKKSQILKPGSELFKQYSLRIQDYLSIDSMIRLFLLFKKAENDRQQSIDKKTPIPYYLVSFIGFFIQNKTPKNINFILQYLFNQDRENFNKIYSYFNQLTNLYKTKSKVEYNVMIKRPIDYLLLKEQIETLDTIQNDNTIIDFINILRTDHNFNED